MRLLERCKKEATVVESRQNYCLENDAKVRKEKTGFETTGKVLVARDIRRGLH